MASAAFRQLSGRRNSLGRSGPNAVELTDTTSRIGRLGGVVEALPNWLPTNSTHAPSQSRPPRHPPPPPTPSRILSQQSLLAGSVSWHAHATTSPQEVSSGIILRLLSTQYLHNISSFLIFILYLHCCIDIIISSGISAHIQIPSDGSRPPKEVPRTNKPNQTKCVL